MIFFYISTRVVTNYTSENIVDELWLCLNLGTSLVLVLLDIVCLGLVFSWSCWLKYWPCLDLEGWCLCLVLGFGGRCLVNITAMYIALCAVILHCKTNYLTLLYLWIRESFVFNSLTKRASWASDANKSFIIIIYWTKTKSISYGNCTSEYGTVRNIWYRFTSKHYCTPCVQYYDELLLLIANPCTWLMILLLCGLCQLSFRRLMNKVAHLLW